MSSWRAAVAVYRDRRMLAILMMGFASGLPLALTGATLSVWLKETGISLTAIGLFALVGLSYNLKFLWAPVLDRVPIPGLTRRLGRRRGWAIAIQLLLMAALVALGHSDPAADPWRLAFLAAVVAFLSASQDIVIDAYRVELLAEREQGAGAAATQIGYRIGMLASGAGALYLAAFFGWSWSYAAMAALVAIGTLAVLMTREPAVPAPLSTPLAGWLGGAVIEPFLDFMQRRRWHVVVAFVVLYKLGGALAGEMANPLYVALGFSKIEIANISKIFGIAASISGVALGGAVVYRAGPLRALLIGGVLQMLANLMYVVQLWAGHDNLALAFTIGVENVTGGMGSAAFVAYLSALCSPAYTATQYALLSSLAAVARTFLSSPSGWLADRFGWAPFFVIATLACLPGLALLAWLMRRDHLAPPPAEPRALAA